MSAPPKTVLTASAEEELAIRAAVRNSDPTTLGPGLVIALKAHVAGLVELLADPAVSDPIYDVPRPLTAATVSRWIAEADEERRLGEGLLMLTLAPDGAVAGYYKITVWPDRSSAELGGALRTDLQSAGSGGAAAAQTIGWIFEELGVRLVCLTAALDNVRAAKLIDRMGFERVGERDCVRPDGTIRRSLYWELTRERWRRPNG